MTREQALEYEATLHRKYFEPFDRLLEKKAQYYLDQVEKGIENKWLLEEIEVLERFREYVAILETVSQTNLDNIFKLAQQAEYWKQKSENADTWETIALHVFSQYERLQEQCQHLLQP
jgi:hypothetical protein